MDIIIQTGFEKINHSISFNPQCLVNAKYMCKANHVCYVKEFRQNCFSYLINCYVIPQTCVTSPPYNVELHVGL